MDTNQYQFSDLAESPVDYSQYRALCAAAVTSLLLGLLSVFAFLNAYLCVIPMLGIFVGIYALVHIAQQPHELTGRGFAIGGIVLSACLLVAASATLVVVYIHEVPEGYQRIYYSQLQPEEGAIRQLVPPLAEAIDQKKVFIKGYVYPAVSQKTGIKTFLLVRDNGDCCFGGNPKATDRIQVTLADPNRLTFSPGLHKVAGTFRLEQSAGTAVDAGGQVFYYLDDCQLR